MGKRNKDKKAKEEENVENDEEILMVEPNSATDHQANSRTKSSKNSKLENIYKELDLDTKKNTQGNRVVYYDKNNFIEENENDVINSDNKMSFPDVLAKFDLDSNFKEANKAKFKRNLKTFINNKDKDKVKIHFDDTKIKVAEREENYSSIVDDVTKYQDKVKVNREADIIDFRVKHNISTSGKSIINNSKEANDFEKSINDLLVKNKYDTDEKILENETKNLVKLDPKEVMRRYTEMQKVKNLLYSQEIKNQRRNKIKSKLYHKIKKKQKDREEELLLNQLSEVDPEAVKNYMEKKVMDRAKERISLKHTNSKFNKTVNRYNLHKEPSMREAIQENFRNRNKLMEKIKGKEEGDDEVSDVDDLEDEEVEESEENNQDDLLNGEDGQEQNEENENEDEEGESGDEENENDNSKKLTLDFQEKLKKKKKEVKQAGVFGMKFMQNSNTSIGEKLNKVIDEIEDNQDDDSDSEAEGGNKKLGKAKPNLQTLIAKAKSKKVEQVSADKKAKYNARVKHTMADEDKEEENEGNETNPSKITSNIIDEVNKEAKKFINEKKKLELNENDVKKIVDLEEIRNDKSNFYENFFVKNDENKKAFEEELKNANKSKEKSSFLSGWGSWAGDSKEVQTKEFLRKKRFDYLQSKREAAIAPRNEKFKISNSIDKKFSKFLVKELPHPFKSEAEFDKMNNNTIGSEWNSLDMYKKMIQPSVLKKIGQIIEPMKLTGNGTNAKKLCDIIEKATKKKVRTKTKI